MLDNAEDTKLLFLLNSMIVQQQEEQSRSKGAVFLLMGLGNISFFLKCRPEHFLQTASNGIRFIKHDSHTYESKHTLDTLALICTAVYHKIEKKQRKKKQIAVV